MNNCKNVFRCLTSLMICWFILQSGYANGRSIISGKDASMPQMNCNDLVHISLDANCTATVTPEAVLEDMIGVNADYGIIVYYPGGQAQPDLLFDHHDIRKVYEYKIVHHVSGNSCWGKILIEDKLPPELECHRFDIRCGNDPSPLSLGLPIPSIFTFTIHHSDTLNDGTIRFIIYNWDQCGYVTLSYIDHVENFTCDSVCIRQIIRNWRAVDSIGNTSYCNDTICILKPTTADIVYPHHFDGFDYKPLGCDSIFKKLPDGNPHPDFTGWPAPKSCTTLNATFSDLKITVCGNTYKVLRRWVILDWCSGAVIEYNQIIKVIDEKAPVVKCPNDITMGMKPWECESYGKLPPPLSVYDCNEWKYDVYTRVENPNPTLPDIVSKQYIHFDSASKSFFLIGAPEGRIWIDYHVEDACGNQAKCTMEVGVVDDLVPIPVCDQKTVVSLGADGTAKVYAETYDDGSLDNCGIRSFRVRRMQDTCHSGTDKFGPYVEFCCADVGQVVMVALEVSDFYGNKNTCMIEATVQDKEPPIVIPPTDITVHCDFPIDFDDLSIFGSVRSKESDRKIIIIPDSYYAGKNYEAGLDGLAYDNCELSLVERYEKNIQCNAGTIKRIFEAKDRQGLVTTAFQTITIINTKPFTRSDIEWPKSVEINSCNNVMTHPDQTGYPKYRNTTCAQVAANYDDLKLAVLDSTCYKILRKWVVIDWCQYDRVTGKGIWDTTQIIVVKSSEPPTIYSCETREFCDPLSFFDGNTNKCMGSYSLTGSGEDDCTEEQDLIWQYRIDENNDGTFGNVKSGNSVSGVLPVGTHRLRWILTDQCNNSSTCDQVFTIKDCKKPTPYCINGIVTVVMHTNGEVTIWAKDFNLGSFDNCTRSQDLKYSFSPNVNNTSITYNCDSLERQTVITKIVRVYVTDEYGNQDYCETSVRIQDNNHVCPGSSPGYNLGGKVTRENQDPMGNVEIVLAEPITDIELDRQNTDLAGRFTFLDLQFKDFYIKPKKQDDLTNGVTTLDIVMIQRHILGIKLLDSPYKLIAADVNNSSNLTAKDISDIRRAILGVITEWPNQTPTWKFITSDHSFVDPKQPWDGPDAIQSKDLTDQLDDLNFTGVKTGDVDLSADLFFQQQQRAHKTFKMIAVGSAGYHNRIDLMASEDILMDGIQLEIQSNGKEGIRQLIPGKLNLQEDDYVIRGNGLRLSYVGRQAVEIRKGEVLFTMVTDPTSNEVSELFSLNRKFRNECYAGEQILALQLGDGVAFSTQPLSLEVSGVRPNPFASTAILSYHLQIQQEVEFKVMDLTGKVLMVRNLTSAAGWNQIEINRKDFGAGGLMFYTLSTSTNSVSGKMILLN